MSTNAMPPAAPAQPMPPADTGAMVPPDMGKTLDNIMGELGRLYRQCHTLAPDSPLCDAVMSVQKAMSEIGRNVGMPEAPADPAAADPMAGPNPVPPSADPMEMPPPPEAGMGGPPPDPFRMAAEDTHNMILDDKKRRG